MIITEKAGFGWYAYDENYNGEGPVGHGETQEAAIDDLLDKSDDLDPARGVLMGLAVAGVLWVGVWVLL